MPSIDMPLEQLRAYKPALTRQDDFFAFWERGLKEASRQSLNATFTRKPYPVRHMDVYEVSFAGIDGATIRGEMIVPHEKAKAPGLMVYHGYSGSHDPINTLLHWAAMGLVVFTVDTRGQRGNTIDPAGYPGPRQPGFMTAGIQSPSDYYYRHVYLDCVRALSVLAERDEVDPSRLAVTGTSQGGGLSLAVASLDSRVAACLPQVPFLCDFPRAVGMAEHPYREIADFLHRCEVTEQAAAFKTLSYFDNVNLAGQIKASVLVSVGLCDAICPPSTIFAAYNQMNCDKQIMVYPYMGHEGHSGFVDACMQKLARQFNL